MNPNELIGKAIIFNKNVNKTEIDFDVGMKARVIGFEHDENMLKLQVDFKEFEEFNKRLMQPSYYDNTGEPRLKWCETRSYPKDCRDSFYVMTEEVENDVCEFDLYDESTDIAIKQATAIMSAFETGKPTHADVVNILKKVNPS